MIRRITKAYAGKQSLVSLAFRPVIKVLEISTYEVE